MHPLVCKQKQQMEQSSFFDNLSFLNDEAVKAINFSVLAIIGLFGSLLGSGLAKSL